MLQRRMEKNKFCVPQGGCVAGRGSYPERVSEPAGHAVRDPDDGSAAARAMGKRSRKAGGSGARADQRKFNRRFQFPRHLSGEVV